MLSDRHPPLRRLQAFLPLLCAGTLFLFALWPWLPFVRRDEPRTLVFYGFSILREVMVEEVFPAFQRFWKGRTGEEVEFISAFAGSGTVTNQLIMGVPAEVALLSLELDALRLSEVGVTAVGSWRRLPHGGVVNRTPFIILVRPGNPKGIWDFADLTRPGIRVVHPDPLTSGGANWAILAEYGAALRQRPDHAQAPRDLLLGIWRNVVAQASSARAARTQFENGFGDALITYEQEALWDRSRGKLQAEIVYPRSTILSEHILVLIDGKIATEERLLVDSFVSFLWSDEAQRRFVKHGFRSVNQELNRGHPHFGKIDDPFLVSDLGGWTRAKREIVDAVWRDDVLKELRP